MKFAAGIGALAMLWAPLASACPFCPADRRASLQSYYGATVLLSVVPLAIFGSILFWLRRSARRAASSGRAAPQGSIASGESSARPPGIAT